MDTQRWRHVLGPHVGLAKEHTRCGFLEAGKKGNDARNLVIPTSGNICPVEEGVGEAEIDEDVENNLRENLHQQPRAWFQEVFKKLIIWY